MSRTYRRRPRNCYRAVRVESTRRMEAAAVDQLREEGFKPSNRIESRVQNIPSAWDDINISAWDQIPKQFWE